MNNSYLIGDLENVEFNIGKHLSVDISKQKLTRFDLILLKTFQEHKKNSLIQKQAFSETSSRTSITSDSSSTDLHKIPELNDSLEFDDLTNNQNKNHALIIPNKLNYKNKLWNDSLVDLVIKENIKTSNDNEENYFNSDSPPKLNSQIIDLIEEFKLRRLNDLKQLHKLCENHIIEEYFKKSEEDSGSESTPPDGIFEEEHINKNLELFSLQENNLKKDAQKDINYQLVFSAESMLSNESLRNFEKITLSQYTNKK